MCVRKLATRKAGACIVAALIVFMLHGASHLWAQQPTQEYFNGSVTAQLIALKDDVASLKDVQRYVFTSVIGVLIVQLFGLLRKSGPRG